MSAHEDALLAQVRLACCKLGLLDSLPAVALLGGYVQRLITAGGFGFCSITTLVLVLQSFEDREFHQDRVSESFQSHRGKRE